MSSLVKLFGDTVTVKVSISVEEESIFLGQPCYLHLCIEKVEGEDVEVFHGCDTRNLLGRSMSFTVRTKDPKGEFVPDPYPNLCCMGGKGCFRRVEPFKRSLFLTHYVKFWMPGTHKIFCKKNFKFQKMGTFVEHKEIEVTTTLQVKKIDPEKFTKLVESWILSCGRNLERIHTNEGERLVKKLRYTKHDSVTDFFVKVLKMKNTENLYKACDYLSKGGTDRGFKALVEIMKNLRVEDIRGYGMQAALNRLGFFQYSIIHAIGQCSHPASLTEVLKASDNPHDSVRRVVCQKCGAIRHKYQLRCYFQLRKYLKDEHDSVKRSALQYLRNHPIDEYQNALILSVKRKEISDIVIVTYF